MEDLTLTTPSILFSAISLLMLAYTNRFLAYAQLVRNLKTEFETTHNPMAHKQLENLRRRLYMSRAMQVFGVASLLLCVICTFLIYIGLQTAAIYTFGAALLLLIISLGISIQELTISVKALEYHLDSMDKPKSRFARGDVKAADATVLPAGENNKPRPSSSRSRNRRRPSGQGQSQGQKNNEQQPQKNVNNR